jgi:hypothetical protein
MIAQNERAPVNCKRIFWASILMASVSGCAHAASVDRFRFSDLDKYPVSGTPDQQYQQLIQHRQQYVLAHFPIGSSVDSAIVNLMNAGARCEFDSDPRGTGEYVCYYDERAFGLAYFLQR